MVYGSVTASFCCEGFGLNAHDQNQARRHRKAREGTGKADEVLAGKFQTAKAFKPGLPALALFSTTVYLPTMRVLIVGCGYVGVPLGAELVRLGHEVFGLRRSPAAEGELTAAGIRPLIGDVTQPESLAKLPRDFDWVVNCVAAGRRRGKLPGNLFARHAQPD